MSDLGKEIEVYLLGEMTPEEQQLFKEKINTNPEARKEFELYQEMNTIFNDADWEIEGASSQRHRVLQHETFLKSQKGKSIATSIQNAENDYFSSQPKNQVRQLIIYAGSIAAILIVGLFIFSQLNKNIDGERLYAAYKNWDELPSLTLRDGNSELALAEKLFRKKEYEKALVIFQNYLSQNTESINSQVLLYTGVTQLELHQNKLALQSFKNLQQSTSLDAPKAHWYLALTYLKTKNKEEAKKELQQLIKVPDAYKASIAKELIKKLD